MDIHFEAEPTEADFGFTHEQSVASVVAKYGESASEPLGAFIYGDSIPNFSAGCPSCSLLKLDLTA